MRRPFLDRVLTIVGSAILISLLLGGCGPNLAGTGAPSIKIPDTCNAALKPVPHAEVRGDNAKVAWRKERAQTDRANGRIVAGSACWSGVVQEYGR